MDEEFHTSLAWAIPIEGTFDPVPQDFEEGSFEHKVSRSIRKGKNVRWGLPFEFERVHMLREEAVSIRVPETRARWLCFHHVAQGRSLPWTSRDDLYESGFDKAMEIGRFGASPLGAAAATYYVKYDDGEEIAIPIRCRYEINASNALFGENCFAAVPEHHAEMLDVRDPLSWGWKQHQSFRFDRSRDPNKVLGWICAWENPNPEKNVVALRFEPANHESIGTVSLWGVVACNTRETPCRWQRSSKLILTLPEGESDVGVIEEQVVSPLPQFAGREPRQSNFMYMNEARRRLLQIDMGTVISVLPHFSYDHAKWKSGPFVDHGQEQKREYLVEFAAHPEARMRTPDENVTELGLLEQDSLHASLRLVRPAHQRVVVRILDASTNQPVAVRLHIHGMAGEYLAPVDRHRLPNSNWFEDYGPESTGRNLYNSTYIDGRTVVDLPTGDVFIEATKGFEYRPVREVVSIDGDTSEVTLKIEKVLDWRENGWITADTHVHFLSPKTGNLEGAAEGVNVVNLLASQWGELMSNVGDFDGKSIYSIRESSHDYLLRVGTENRQNVLGHISLIGYEGPIIAPMCADGPVEGAIGRPVDTLLLEWAEQCRAQNGIVVLPHTPLPRAEDSAAIVSGNVDAFEVCAIGGFVGTYTLANWYRYLNCGYHMPLAGGTDKMSADMEIGRARVYSKLLEGEEFGFDAWKRSIRRGNTFVTFGPLVEFSVEQHEPGSRISLGGEATLTALWHVATIKFSVTSVEMIVNGEIRGQKLVDVSEASGSFELNVSGSCWVGLLIRGLDNNRVERILAHTSVIMIDVEGDEFYSAPDALSILEQIEGSMAYLENIGTRADERRYKEMMLKLEASYYSLHRRMHRLGHMHTHTVTKDHH